MRTDFLRSRTRAQKTIMPAHVLRSRVPRLGGRPSRLWLVLVAALSLPATMLPAVPPATAAVVLEPGRGSTYFEYAEITFQGDIRSVPPSQCADGIGDLVEITATVYVIEALDQSLNDGAGGKSIPPDMTGGP